MAGKGLDNVEARLEKVVNPEPDDIDGLRKWLGLTQEELAGAVGRSRRTVARWTSTGADRTEARGESARTLRKLRRLRFLLEDVLGREEALRWMRSPNRGFRGEAPVDVLVERGPDDLIGALEMLADGGAY